MYGTTQHWDILKCKVCASWFQRRRLFNFFSIIGLLGANDPRGVASLDPRVLIGRIYTLLHTKYVSCRPHGFREEDFSIFFYKFMGANGTRGVARGSIGRIYVGNY